MELNFFHFLIVCPLVGIAGFIDAVAGGGGLISLPAYMIAGLPTHFAIATNKISSCMGTSAATFKYARNGFIPWKIATFCIFFAFSGSAIGARLALLLSDRYFKIFILVVLPITAMYVMRKNAFDKDKPPLTFVKTVVFASIISFAIGIYDGFYGPGTGMFLILLFTSAAHMNIQNANGLTKVINLSTNIAAVVVYLSNGKVMLLMGFAAGVFNILGNCLGVYCFEKKGVRAVKPLMLLVLLIFFVKVITDLLK